jgi:hypothetical protein
MPCGRSSITELKATTVLWLDVTLASPPERPALLFLHHPPFGAAIWVRSYASCRCS